MKFSKMKRPSYAGPFVAIFNHYKNIFKFNHGKLFNAKILFNIKKLFNAKKLLNLQNIYSISPPGGWEVRSIMSGVLF